VLLPLHKKGSTSDMNNYRGIALLSSVAKLFDKLLLYEIRDLIDPTPASEVDFPEKSLAPPISLFFPENCSSTNENKSRSAPAPPRPSPGITVPSKRQRKDSVIPREQLRPNQAGFRRGRSCAEQILALRLVVESCTQFRDKSAILCFIDFSKAFDSVDRSYLVECLVELAIPSYLIKAAMSMYINAKAQVLAADGFSDDFSLDHGVLQGDTLAPFLFVVVLNRVLKKAIDEKGFKGYLIKERDGSRKPAITLSDLEFADDIALVAETAEEAQKMLNSVDREARLAGLRINILKTKWMVFGDLAASSFNLFVSGQKIEKVNDFKYLGSYISSTSSDVAARKSAAAKAFGQLRNVFHSSLSKQIESQVFKSVIEPVLLYGCEIWALTSSLRAEVSGCWFKFLRWSMHIDWRLRRSNESLLTHPLQVVKERTLGLVGHFLRARSRELTEGVLAPPLSHVLAWSGEDVRQYTSLGTVRNTKQTMRRGQGNRQTFFRSVVDFLEHPVPDSAALISLANCRTK
jgi:Reverse transcriptase (RNA-dependent DNA polymerase)